MAGKFKMPEKFEANADVRAGFDYIGERLDDVEKAIGGQSAEAISSVRTELADVVAGQAALAEKLKAATHSPVSDTDMASRVAGLSLPFDVDEEFSHVSREQWNLLNYKPDELAFASSASRFHTGLGVQTVQAINGSRYSEFDHVMTRTQQVNDALYILHTILSKTEAYQRKGDTVLQRMKSLKLWKEWERLTTQLRVAGLNTEESGAGSQWLPSYFSAQMHDLVQLELGVANLFPSIDMPGKQYTSPVLYADGTCYYVPEQVTGTVGSGTAIPVSNPTTGNMVLNAWKIASRMFCTSEATEDLIIPVIPFMLGQLAKVIARGDDDICLNADGIAGAGHDAYAHMDVGRTTAPAGPQTADVTHLLRVPCQGLRKMANVNGWSNGTTGAACTIDLSVPSYPIILTARGRLGSLGRRASDLPLIVNMNGLIRLYQLTDGSTQGTAPRLLMTVDKYGPGALVRTGEVGNIAGHPVIVNEFVPNNMDSVSGGGSGVRTEAGAYTCCIMPHVPSFVRGIRRGVTITRSSERHIEYDQLVFVVTARRDFQKWYAAATPQAVVFAKM